MMAKQRQECLVCGATESMSQARNIQTGQVHQFEEWFPLRDRRTGEVLGYQCVKCWDRLPGRFL